MSQSLSSAVVSIALATIGSGVARADAVQDWNGPWGAPVNVGPPLNTEFNDMYALVTRDGLTVYFSSDRPGGLGGDDLWVSYRESTSDPWGTPENLAVLNSAAADSLSVLSTSEKVMFFHSTRAGGCGSGDLWVSRKSSFRDTWRPPENMGCVVNSTAFENAPAFYAHDSDLTYLYFGSNRAGGVGDFDVWVTTTTDQDLETAVFTEPVNVTELNSVARDTRTFVREDGREIYITTDRSGGVGGLDMWVSTRDDNTQPWSTPTNPGPGINSTAADGSPALSKDGKTLYFFSTRAGGLGLRDIWVATRD
jgi:hypothetical protein